MKAIKVGGITYRIEMVEVLEVDGDRNVLGTVDYRAGTIKVVSGMGEERTKQVIVHELVHAMMFEAGYDEQDEDMVHRLSLVMHQVLNDNNWGGGIKWYLT